jgi:hypothetical protein
MAIIEQASLRIQRAGDGQRRDRRPPEARCADCRWFESARVDNETRGFCGFYPHTGPRQRPIVRGNDGCVEFAAADLD